MHITKLKIENFRGIREMELELHPKMNIFIGVNGAGKSNVLDALGYLLEPVVKLCSQNTFPKGYANHDGNDFPDTEISIGQSESKLTINIGARDLPTESWLLRSLKNLQLKYYERIQSGTQLVYSNAGILAKYIAGDEDGRNLTPIMYYRTHRGVTGPLK